MKINSNNCDLDEKNLFINSSFGDKPNLKQQLLSFDFEKRLSAVIKIRKLLSIEKNPPIQEILDAQILPILIKYIEEEKNIQFKFEIAYVIC